MQVELVRQTFESAEAQIEFLRSLDGGAIYRLSYGVSVQDPSFISNVALSTSSGNRTGYNNPEVDELVAQADSELDHDRRCELYAEIDRIISEEAMFMAPFRGTSTWFFQPEVRGMRVAMGRIWHSIHQMYIAEAE